jgi:hypothetical protein
MPDSKQYYRVIAIKSSWYCHKNKYEDQWNTIGDPEKIPSSCAHLIFHKGTKNRK